MTSLAFFLILFALVVAMDCRLYNSQFDQTVHQYVELSRFPKLVSVFPHLDDAKQIDNIIKRGLFLGTITDDAFKVFVNAFVKSGALHRESYSWLSIFYFRYAIVVVPTLSLCAYFSSSRQNFGACSVALILFLIGRFYILLQSPKSWFYRNKKLTGIGQAWLEWIFIGKSNEYLASIIKVSGSQELFFKCDDHLLKYWLHYFDFIELKSKKKFETTFVMVELFVIGLSVLPPFLNLFQFKLWQVFKVF